MASAYVDTSALIAISFGEPGAADLARRLDSFDLMSANLLEAEFRAAHEREGAPYAGVLLEGIEWVLTDRALGPEIERVFETGYVKGADAWHLASALSVVGEPSEVTFVTLDERQREVAAALGFET